MDCLYSRADNSSYQLIIFESIAAVPLHTRQLSNSVQTRNFQYFTLVVHSSVSLTCPVRALYLPPLCPLFLYPPLPSLAVPLFAILAFSATFGAHSAFARSNWLFLFSLLNVCVLHSIASKPKRQRYFQCTPIVGSGYLCRLCNNSFIVMQCVALLMIANVKVVPIHIRTHPNTLK